MTPEQEDDATAAIKKYLLTKNEGDWTRDLGDPNFLDFEGEINCRELVKIVIGIMDRHMEP